MLDDDALAKALLDRRRAINEAVRRAPEDLRLIDKLLDRLGIATGEAVFASPRDNGGPHRGGRVEDVLNLLRQRGPMSTRDLYDAVPDHFGYGTDSGLRKALEAREQQGLVRRDVHQKPFLWVHSHA